MKDEENIEKNKGGFLLYKCRICGGIEKKTHAPDGLIALIHLINGDKLPWEGVQPYMLTLHTCNKKSTGIADLIGVEYDE